MRPSEEVALVLSDIDLVNGIVSVKEARVAGIDRDRTKTGDDRRITLCPRALAVLERQLSLRARPEATGIIRRDHVFCRETGEVFRNPQIQARRWRAALTSLKVRYRRPYVARHSSVSCGVGRRIAPPASRRTEREALASLSSHQINEPIIPIFQ
jgi:integrase